MSTAGYTGNPTPNIYPFAYSDNTCFRFTDKGTTGCERALYANYFAEQISLYGQKVAYYVHGYSTLSADNLYGEDPTRRFADPVEIVIGVNLNENSLMLSKYGLVSDDELTGYIPISSFKASFGLSAEPKAGDVFNMVEYGMDRPGGRGGNNYEITQRLDQDIAQINPLAGHYVWMIKAKRFEYSFEPNIPDEKVNNQVFEDKTVTTSDGLPVSGASKTYSYNVDAAQRTNVFDYTQTNGNDSVYGGYVDSTDT